MDVQNKTLGEQNDPIENLIAFCFSMSIFENNSTLYGLKNIM